MLFAQAKSYRRVFAGGEDSYALPLTSELAALCGENVNRFPQHFASESGLKSGRYMPKKKTDHEGRLSFLARVDRKDADYLMIHIKNKPIAEPTIPIRKDPIVT